MPGERSDEDRHRDHAVAAREGAGVSREAQREIGTVTTGARRAPPPRRRALVLAAGYGTRLRPLTEELPKPLLPVLGRTLLERTLMALATAGCEAVAINLHHLADAIPAAIGERWEGMPVVYSREEPILGTLGAFVPLRAFFAGCDEILLVNGDSLCDWPLAELLARHRRAGGAATILLAGRPDPRPFGGGLGIDRRGRVTAIRSDRAFGEVRRRFVYAGAYVLGRDLLARIPDATPADSMRDLFEPLLAAGGPPLASLVTWRPWHDLGTPARYLAGVTDWLRRERGASGSWVSPRAEVAASARLAGSVVEAGARVAEGAGLAGSLLLAGSVVEAGARLERCLVGPGAVVPGGLRLVGQLATRGRGEEPTGARREGPLALTPLAGG